MTGMEQIPIKKKNTSITHLVYMNVLPKEVKLDESVSS